jgi:DNA transposition AAA+ family ATPase
MTPDSTHPIIASLIAHQAQMSDQKFCDRYLSAPGAKISSTVWHRLKKGEYQRKDFTDLLDKLENALRGIEDHASLTEKMRDNTILPLTTVRASLAAVRKAFDQPRDRLCVILTPTGGGKTTIARAINEAHKGRTTIVEATETWRSSYVSAVHAIGEALGLGAMPASARAAQSLLFAELKARPRILVIDEGNYFGQASLNLIKAILNQTGCTVVILALPELWAAMKRRTWSEASQLRTRTIAFLDLKAVERIDVEAILKRRLGTKLDALGKAAKDVINSITAKANSFGLFDTVVQMAEAIADDAGEGELTIDIVETAIRNIQIMRS